MSLQHISRSSAASWHKMNALGEDNWKDGLGYLLDERYLLHDPGKEHPESPQRLIAIQQMLEAFGGVNRWQRLQPRCASFDELELVHNPAHIARVEAAAKRAPSYLDFDTSLSTESYQTALLAAGGVLQCVDSICSGSLRKIFAFVRPPGHHAGPESARGFCLFNNIALAAAYARTEYKLERLAIIDIDVHHGNGTQSCFYSDPAILYISSHQFPFYPGSGNFNEIGRGEGKGYTLNFPLPEGTGDSGFVPIYTKIVSVVLDQFAPQLILVSAGFDGHFRDPLGGLALTQAGYSSVAASLIRAAERWCNGRICFILEGGYSLQALKDCIRAIMVEMEAQSPSELSVQEGPVFHEISRQAAKFTAGQWKW
jgi:acetoin utilization deacetylase AcuC-like enzyme